MAGTLQVAKGNGEALQVLCASAVNDIDGIGDKRKRAEFAILPR